MHDDHGPYTRGAVDSLTAAVHGEQDFSGWLAGVLATVAAREGSTFALVSSRPGSWEARLVLGLVRGITGYEDEYLHLYRGDPDG